MTRPFNFKGVIGIATVTKLLLNVARRMVYPFAPEFARGLDVELSAITSAIALNQATSVLGPVGASFADRYGVKLLMLLAVAGLALGCFTAGLIPLYPALMVCLFLAGLAKSVFDPSLQAFIGNQIPYEHRAKVIGITEIAWAGATLAGIPAAGLLMEKFTFQTPFWVIGVLSLFCLFLIWKFMPEVQGPRSRKKTGSPGAGSQVLSNWKTVGKSPGVQGLLGFAFFMSLANDNLFVIYGAWLEKSYSLSLAAIGFGTVFIGVSEILGEGCTALFADRIGLTRAVLGGTLVCALAYFLLPAADLGLPFVLAGLFGVFFVFEFTIVSSMGLGTELLPELRASTMSAFYAIAGLGRVAGAFAGGMIWSRYGILGISLVSGFCCLAAFASLALGFYQGRTIDKHG